MLLKYALLECEKYVFGENTRLWFDSLGNEIKF